MKSLGKKKPKRFSKGRANDSEFASWLQKFSDSGALVSILLLGVFIIIASAILSADSRLYESKAGFWAFVKSLLVIGSIITFLSIGLGHYVMAYEPQIVKNHLRGSVLLASLSIMIGLVRLGVIRGWPMHLLVVPVMITAIMMTIAYSQRLALGISAFLGLISVLAWADMANTFKEGLGILLATGSGVGIAILSLREIRTRTKLIEVCGMAGIVVFAMNLILSHWHSKDWQFWNSLLVGGATWAVGFLMQGFLPVIERVFRTASNMTLLDYGEATKPLLKRLAVEAPGTFNHSWQVGMLSEAAAEAVGANGLLCRVGSYYHDVGKLNKPRYFVENQAEYFNQHRELSPTMSRMIIVGHVRDGLELLQEYKIPRILHQFTDTHHGTTLVEFFYYEAIKKGPDSGRKIAETEFRYPGHKPASREAAIVMLADAVEGASRAVNEPTPSRIENLVHDIAMKRLQDGQFNDCDLTMRELHLIEESLIKSLCGMYHARIAYPKQELSKPAKTATK